jgi:hypothetical protein
MQQEFDPMLSRLRTVRVAWVFLLPAALLLASSIVAFSAEGRVRLGADVLARSRGGNPNLVLTQTQCNLLNGNFACAAQGDSCVSCEVNTFTNTMPGSNGGYTQGTGTQACGFNWDGLCTVNLTCFPDERVGICQSPAAIVVQ